MTDLIWTPIKIRLGQIIPWSENPRMSTKAQAQRLIKSERELGQIQTLAVSPFEDGKVYLYDGHQRVSAWMTIKDASYEVTALQSNRMLTDDERKKVSVLLHTATGSWSWEALASWSAADLREWGMDEDTLKGWNNDANNLKEMLETEKDLDDIEPTKTLAERFGVPPFSVLDARQGYWQDRKRAWIALGIKGELGRDGALAYASKHATDEVSAKILEISGGTSVFDPVLSEMLYRWFTPKGGHILNPMSGEATHGIVAGRLGYKFTGVELRPEQAESNREQARNIGVDPVWITADALTIDTLGIAPADFVVSCPPYADLEIYSDNPLDISTMEYKDFIRVYSEIIKKSCAILQDDRFAAFVVGEVRDSKGNYYNFVGDTIKAFVDAGLEYYNEMIYVTPLGTVMMQTSRNFPIGRKVGKTHQNVLVFLKGDSKRAVKACGNIEMELPDGFEVS